MRYHQLTMAQPQIHVRLLVPLNQHLTQMEAEALAIDVNASDIVGGKAPDGKIVVTVSPTGFGTLAAGSGLTATYTAS